MSEKYVIGIDYGSDSARAIVVDVSTGQQLSQGVAYYPRWKKGLFCHPEQQIFRQHPLDYLEALELCVGEALSELTIEDRRNIIGIGIDTTGSTPAPANGAGVPLALLPEFEENENAMFYLWKDHSAAEEAEEINKAFAEGTDTDYTKYQGKYCSEWYWAKILHAIRTDARIKKAAYTWIEHCDWMVGILTGNTSPEVMYHSACAAGHKALWHSEWRGLPDKKCLEMVDPYLALIAERYGKAPGPAVVKAGVLTKEWAKRLGLPEGIAISGSSFDAHAGAVGAGICHGTLVCTLGTSAVDMLIEKAEALEDKQLLAYCGQAENSIVPGYVGIETGQAAFGDVFAWFKNLLMWAVRQAEDHMDKDVFRKLYEDIEKEMLSTLEAEAQKLPDEPFPVILDWFNGRRYPNTDDFQKAVMGQLTLGVNTACLYRSLVFSTLCGLKRIVEGFENAGLDIKQVVAVGGISKKSEFLMQMMADLLGKRVEILEADQTCALGAAIYAAVAAGSYPDIEQAVEKMASKCIKKYYPQEAKKQLYENHYLQYCHMAEIMENNKI